MPSQDGNTPKALRAFTLEGFIEAWNIPCKPPHLRTQTKWVCIEPGGLLTAFMDSNDVTFIVEQQVCRGGKKWFTCVRGTCSNHITAIRFWAPLAEQDGRLLFKQQTRGTPLVTLFQESVATETPGPYQEAFFDAVGFLGGFDFLLPENTAPGLKPR